ncbi:MAG: ABC transporter substrate-binding protein [Deltaproteobacteria bacterium]|nr:ABC transporter substrate-binding protein [Deltaproteobacteria bacterium]
MGKLTGNRLSFILFPVILLALFGLCYASEEMITAHALAMHGKPKYGPDFKHFDYVNPDAPKGGTITYSAIGTYDNFHRYAQRGLAAAGSDGLYDTLMTYSEDEIDVSYPLIAEKVAYPLDYTWMIFYLNPRARFQDGEPITSEDVVFSFYKFFNEGVPQFKQIYKDVQNVEALDKSTVRFTLKTGNKESLFSLAGGLKILPKHYWEGRNFSEPHTVVPVGSSAYTIKEFKIGQYVVYERVKDYWAADLPVNRGQNNFDKMRYDYYRDDTVSLEAFKSGEFDIRQENVAKYWAAMYTGSNFDKGYIIKEMIDHEIPQGMQAFVFNTKRPVFSDIRVREAISYALDFEWLNKNLFYNQYARNRSYFSNTPYEAKGLPGKGELAILEAFRGKIPERVFTEEYNPSVTDGTGNIRPQIRKALELFKKAGWEIKDRVLKNTKSGETFRFELMLYSPAMEAVAISLQNNLKKMGIEMNIRQVDTTQFTNRLRERDFDMISEGYSAMPYPSKDLMIIWHSDYIDHTYNTAGVRDPVIDKLAEDISGVQEDEAKLLSYGMAFDRVLQWNFFVIPQWHLGKFRVAYWNKFSRPETRPKYALGINTWWVDSSKAKKLPKRNAAD